MTHTTVIDNLRAAVTQADWFDPELNPKINSFAEHYQTVILPTKPYTPRHKGKIEAGIKYVQNNALKGRVFQSLAQENQFLLEWESRVADTRIHGTTRQQVAQVFNTSEKPKLLPLPPRIFPVFSEAPRTVHRDGHVEVANTYFYFVPPEYVGRKSAGAVGAALGADLQHAHGTNRLARPSAARTSSAPIRSTSTAANAPPLKMKPTGCWIVPGSSVGTRATGPKP